MSQYAVPADISGEVTTSELRPRFIGTYSYVYLGMFRNRRVSIKVLRLVSQASLHAMRRKMYRERDVWAGLKHPSIAPFYGYVEAGGIFGDFGALISQWYENGDAGRYLSKHGSSLDLSVRSKMLLGVICGVNYLHTLSPTIIHGDLKPGNILLDDQLNPKICDFGLARILFDEGSTGLTTTSEHFGTERYLAFELVGPDDSCIPTLASDVFALGCIALEFIYLQPPHANCKRRSVLLDIQHRAPPARRPPGLHIHHSRLWDILEACWRIDPSERPNSGIIRTSFHQWYLTLLEGLSAERHLEGDINGVSRDPSSHSLQAGGNLPHTRDNSNIHSHERLINSGVSIGGVSYGRTGNPSHMTGPSRMPFDGSIAHTHNPLHHQNLKLNPLLSTESCQQLLRFDAVQQPATLTNGDSLRELANEFATSPPVNEIRLWTDIHPDPITVSCPRGITVGHILHNLGEQLFRTIRKSIWLESRQERQNEIAHWFWHNRKHNSMPPVKSGIVYADLLGASTVFAGLMTTDSPDTFVVRWIQPLALAQPPPAMFAPVQPPPIISAPVGPPQVQYH